MTAKKKVIPVLLSGGNPQIAKADGNAPVAAYIDGEGWFMSFHTFANDAKVTFFMGTSLKPAPPGGTTKETRWIDVHQDDLDEKRMVKWIKQSAAIPGWLNP